MEVVERYVIATAPTDVMDPTPEPVAEPVQAETVVVLTCHREACFRAARRKFTVALCGVMFCHFGFFCELHDCCMYCLSTDTVRHSNANARSRHVLALVFPLLQME